MECLQYYENILDLKISIDRSFKPCYKWNAFNTTKSNGFYAAAFVSFKPCYNWNAFNTYKSCDRNLRMPEKCFKPCYKWNAFNTNENR